MIYDFCITTGVASEEDDLTTGRTCRHGRWKIAQIIRLLYGLITAQSHGIYVPC
jgi:hypothetical protein